MTTMAVALDRNLFLAYYSSYDTVEPQKSAVEYMTLTFLYNSFLFYSFGFWCIYPIIFLRYFTPRLFAILHTQAEHGHLDIINTYIALDNKIVKTDIEKFFPLKRAIILGDLNAHSRSWGCTNANEKGHILEEVINDRLLTVLNTGQPTRISSINSKTQSVIDLSIVTKELALNCKH